MSKKTGLRMLTNMPSLPTTKERELNLFLADLSRVVQGLASKFNAYIDADIREDLPTTVTGLSTSTGLPSLSLLLFNARVDEDGLFHKVNKSNASWALQFGDTSDQLLILYAATGVDPITWTTYGSMNNTGVPSAATDLVRNSDLLSVGVLQAATPDAESPSRAEERVKNLERLLWVMMD